MDSQESLKLPAGAAPVELPAESVVPSGPGPFRNLLDWALLASVIGSVGMLWFHSLDLWYRTDLRFFPLLPLISIFLILRNGKLGMSHSRRREQCALAFTAAAASLAVLAVLIFSTWMACVSLVLATIAWMLHRFGGLPWYRTVGWTIPLWVVLLFPNSDATDATRRMERAVASSSSAVLDVIGIPQIASGNMLEFKQARLSTSKICRGLGNPYLLLAAVVLLSVLTRRSLSVGLITALTVPLWSWIGAVLHVVIGLYVWEVFDRNLFPGYRNVLMQMGVLALTLLSIWLFQEALAVLLTPFRAYTQNVGWVHRWFNRLALWPGRDPLRKAKPAEEEEFEIPTGYFWKHRLVQLASVASIIAFAVAGGLSIYFITSFRAGQQLQPLEVSESSVDAQFKRELLPDSLGAMRQIAFEIFHNQDAAFSGAHSASWIYTADLRRVRLAVDLPGRGFFPIERSFLSPVRKFAKPRESFSVEVEGFGRVLLDEIELLDDLYGRSYACYATLTLNDFPPYRTALTEGRFSWEGLANSLALQPTVVNIQLFVESAGVLTDEERSNYRDTLTQACSLLREPLLALASESHSASGDASGL